MHLHLYVALAHTRRERYRAAHAWADAFDTSLTSQRERYIAQARHGQALGLLILRAQRREERAIQAAVDEHARRYRRDEAHRRLSEGLGRGWC